MLEGMSMIGILNKIKHLGQIDTDFLIERQQAEICVEARCFLIEVTSTDMTVEARFALLLPGDKNQLAMHFQTGDAKDHIDPPFGETLRPTDVRCLIESGLKLNDSGHALVVRHGVQ